MKRNLLLLAVMILTVFTFSSLYAQCPQAPNDNGNCDTLFLEVWNQDVNFTTSPMYARVNLYALHDTPNPVDSIAAFVLPLCYTHSNPAKYCSVTSYMNAILWTTGALPRSIFRHMPDNTTATVHNWMMDLFQGELGEEWNGVILDLNGIDHFWLTLIPSGSEDARYGDNAKRLIATATFKLEDSMMVCIDTCFWPPSSRVAYSRADAVTYIPRLSWQNEQGEGAFCHDFFIIPHQRPELTCPGTQNHNVNGSFSAAGTYILYDDATVSSLTAAFTGGGVNVGTPTYDAGNFTIPYDVINHCAAGGSVEVIITDSFGAKDTCYFGINLTNAAPVVTCPGNQILYVPGGVFNGTATATDANGDALTFSGGALNPAWVTVGAGGAINAAPAVGDTGIFEICVVVTDVCGAADECCFQIEVKAIVGIPNHVYIPITDCVEPGHIVDLPIIAENFMPGVCFGGFELEIEFDYTAMTFVGADRGAALEQDYVSVLGSDTTFYSWEYFNYRMLPCPLCACCKYKILMLGMKDLPNGPFHQGYCICPTGVDTLVVLHFVVNNDQNLQGLLIPVCFEWEGDVVDGVVVRDWDCAENTFSNCSGDTLFVSNKLCEWVADLCDDPGSITRLINFQTLEDCGVCGGVMVCSPSGEECKRGDINYNSLPYEVADAVLFASYFAEGITVFGPEPDRSIKVCATDVNHDGRALTLSDLVYLIRVILHDAVEIPKLAPSSVANVIVSNGIITTEGANIGAIVFEFDIAVNPTLLATNMEMINNDTKVLVWSRTGNSIETAAEVIRFAGDAKLVSVTAVDRDSRTLTTAITAKVAPTTFALHPAYPNPFNPNTNLSFSLPEATNYSLKIYNVAGQLVRTFEGSGTSGLNVITWNGQDNAGNSVSSGVYFFKLIAGTHSATQKMVMMK